MGTSIRRLASTLAMQLGLALPVAVLRRTITEPAETGSSTEVKP